MKLIKSFGILSILQIFNLMIPFAIYPYLIRIYGSTIYGEYVFSMAVAALLQVIVNYGFELSGTKDISEYATNGNKLSEIFCSIFKVKLILVVIITISMMLVLNYINVKSELFFLCFIYVVLESLFPLFVFNGLEKQQKIALIQIPCRIIYLIMIFVFIRAESNILTIVFFQIVASLLSLILSIVYLRKTISIKFVNVSFRTLYLTFKGSTIYFMSRVAGIINLKTASLTIGFLFSPNILAMYDLCMKVIDLLRMPITILNQVIYPRVVKTKSIKIVNICLLIFSIYSLFSYFIVSEYGAIIIKILGGDEMIEAFDMLSYLIILVPMSVVSWILGNNALIAFGFKKYFFRSVIYSTLFLISYTIYLTLFKVSPEINDVLNGVIITASIILFFRIFYSLKSHYRFKVDK